MNETGREGTYIGHVTKCNEKWTIRRVQQMKQSCSDSGEKEVDSDFSERFSVVAS